MEMVMGHYVITVGLSRPVNSCIFEILSAISTKGSSAVSTRSSSFSRRFSNLIAVMVMVMVMVMEIDDHQPFDVYTNGGAY